MDSVQKYVQLEDDLSRLARQRLIDLPNIEPDGGATGRLSWAIITGNYADIGGVADYTRQVAHALSAVGDHVTVYAPTTRCPPADGSDVEVVGLPGVMGPSAIRTLDRALSLTRPDRVLLQYVPMAFGWEWMNVPFCLWLFARRARYRFSVMFHEVACSLAWNQALRHNVRGVVTHLMAALAAQAADRIFVAIPGWERILGPMIGYGRSMTWIPIPSNVPVIGNREAIAKTKARYTQDGKLLVGQFGMYGARITEARMALLPIILRGGGLNVLLLAHGSEIFRERLLAAYPEFAGSVHATGTLSPAEISNHLGACDLMVQPYHDGITTRRTSAMACLSHALPIVTTMGDLTEPLWKESRAVLLSPVDNLEHLARQTQFLLNDAAERRRLGASGKALYDEHFTLTHTIAKLRLPLRS